VHDADEPLAYDARPMRRRADAPRLGHAGGPLLRRIEIIDQHGERRAISIPAERPLTVFVDKRELVTLMTLGASPALLVLGYLLNQGLIDDVAEIDGIDVD
jgi:FdhD protein